MAEDDRLSEQNFKRSTEASRIELVDQIIDSPSARAKKIHDILKNSVGITEWDVICFSAEFLGVMHHAYPWLELPAKHILKLIYTAHYYESSDVARLSPDFGMSKDSDEGKKEAGS